MTARLSRIPLAVLLALATLAALPASQASAAAPVPAGSSLPWAAVAFAGVHRDAQGHVDAAVVGVLAVVFQPKNRVKGKTDPAVLATLKSASLAALSELGKACGYDGLASGAPVYVNGDPVNLSDPSGHNPYDHCKGDSCDSPNAAMRNGDWMAPCDAGCNGRIAAMNNPLRQAGAALFGWLAQGTAVAHGGATWLMDQAPEAGTGLGIGAVQLGEGLWNTALLAGDCATLRSACGDKVGAMATAIGRDPGRFAGSLIDYEDFSHGHIARGFGHVLPSIALALVTAGAGSAISKGGEVVGAADAADTAGNAVPAFARSAYGRAPAALRGGVLEDNPVCVYCGQNPSTTLDHISSLKQDWLQGGYNDDFATRTARINDPENLTGGCLACNAGKGARPLGEGPGQWWPSAWPSGVWWPFGGPG